jgi:hypothetical protein
MNRQNLLLVPVSRFDLGNTRLLVSVAFYLVNQDFG